MNLKNTIIPKSDQLNSDDLISGPIDITITAVKSGSAEQPVTICYEGDNGRPYKPSKSMRRVLVSVWGADGNEYVGRRLRLYRDPAIKFGGDAVGGIRISHMSDLDEPVSIALTETRGRRKPFRVEPMPNSAPDEVGDLSILEDIGDTKASEGKDALRQWWEGSLNAAQRKALKSKLPGWKEKAQ